MVKEHNMRAHIALLAVLGLCAIGSHSRADVIYLKDGERQTGLITLDRADLPTITLRTGSGQIAIRRDRIDRVERESEAISRMHVGDQFMDRGDFVQAAEEFRTGLKLDKDNADLKARFAKAEAGIAGLAEVAAKESEAQLNTTLEKVLQLTRDKQFEEAARLLRANEPAAGSPRADEFRKTYAKVYTEWGLDRIDRQDFTGAAEKLQLALKYDPASTVAKSQLIRVWEQDPTRLNEVAEYYKSSSAPEDQIKLADIYFRMRNYEAALPIYLKILNEPALATQTIRDRVRQMYDMLHRQYADAGEYQKALDTYKAFLQYSPQEDPTPLARYEYMLRRAQTDMNDVAARVRLAAWAEQRGLADTARDEYFNVLKMAPSNKAAQDAIRGYAAADIQEANDYFVEQQYLLAQQTTQQIARDYSMFSDIVNQAQQIQTKAAVEMQRVQQSRQQQAVALALRGDDYYNSALSYISAMMSTNVERSTRVFSPKQEATRYLARALYAWNTAMQIDPSLGAASSYDLTRKIQEAYSKYAVLAYPYAPRLPSRDLDRITRSQDVPGSR